MAKAGFWLRGATGKLAGSALQKGADGSTIIREIVQPTNPKTESQKIQRIVMTTVMQAYSHMKAITDHSFEGVTAGAATMSTFMRYNLNMLRQKVATGIEAGEDIETMYHFCPTGAKMFAPNDYIISAGSLPGIGVVYSNNIPGNVVSQAYAGIELPVNTYRSLIETYGLRRGDQITLISVQGQRQSALKFYFARIILDPTNADGSQASLDSPLVADGAINLPSPRNEGEFAGLIYNNGKLFYSFVANQWVSTAGVIVSRKDNNKWLRSNCTMKANEDVILLDEYSLGYCLSNFNATEIGTLSNRMLNNAGTGHVVQDSGSTKTIIMYTATPHPDDPRPVPDTEHVIVRTYMKGGLLVAVDDNGKEWVVTMKDSSMASYAKTWKNLSNLCTKALIVANWTGFPADADTDEKKSDWLDANYVSPLHEFYYEEDGRDMPAEKENRLRSEQIDAVVAWGFSLENILYGTPTISEW